MSYVTASHLEKFSLNFSSSSFAIRVNLLSSFSTSATYLRLAKGPFTQAIFVALKLQPAAISARFYYSLSVQNVSARLFHKQKLCACSKVKLLLKVSVFRELHLKPRR